MNANTDFTGVISCYQDELNSEQHQCHLQIKPPLTTVPSLPDWLLSRNAPSPDLPVQPNASSADGPLHQPPSWAIGALCNGHDACPSSSVLGKDRLAQKRRSRECSCAYLDLYPLVPIGITGSSPGLRGRARHHLHGRTVRRHRSIQCKGDLRPGPSGIPECQEQMYTKPPT